MSEGLACILMVGGLAVFFWGMRAGSTLLTVFGIVSAISGLVGTSHVEPYVQPAPKLVGTVKGCEVYRIESRSDPTLYTTICEGSVEWETHHQAGKVRRTERHRVETKRAE